MKRIFTPAKKKAILIVDDDHVAIHIYREKFQSHGCNVEIAGDGDSAMQSVKSNAVDLVILDLCLPGTSTVELIQNIRSNSATQMLPIIAFSNPYLGSLTRAGVEAGVTKCVAKADVTLDEMFEIMQELGLNATSRVDGDLAGTLEVEREKLSVALLIKWPERLAELRASYQVFAKIEQEDLRRAELFAMHRRLRSLAGGASFLGFEKIAQTSTALEALLIELHTKPVKITPSVVRTVAQAIDTLASLFDRAANHQVEVTKSPKILVVDDEIISRETICSALGKARLHPLSLDDPLAAQRLLEQEKFDLIFLDVEMPGQTGLELCVKIREMAPNHATPVVFVTSHSDFGSRAHSTLSGGNDFIAKPFVSVELVVKALTWLFKEIPPVSSMASTQESLSVAASDRESEAFESQSARSLHAESVSE